MDTHAVSLTPTVPDASRPDPALRFAQLTRLLQRNLWLIALCGLLGGGVAYLYARTLPKIYTATSVMAIEGDRFAIPELQGALRDDNASDPMPIVRTELQALTSRASVTDVVGKLNLAALPEFNGALRPPTFIQQAKDYIGGLVGPVLPPGPASAPLPGPDEAVVGSAFQALTVFQDNRSLVISLAFTSQDPRLAASFLNTLMGDYVHSRAQRRQDATEGANNVLVQRIDQVRAELADIEQKMRDLRSKGDLVALPAGSVGQQQVQELTSAAARATLERSQLEENYNRAMAATKQGSSDALAAVLNSPTISRLRDQEAQSLRHMAELSSRYGADYPGMRSAGAELASTRRQINDESARIVASLASQLSVARSHESDVLQQLEKSRHVGVQAENARAQLDQLQQEATTRRALYQTLLERAQQTVAQSAATVTPDVRVLSPAIPPGSASGPNMKLAGMMGGAGGALLGCLLALTRIRTVRGFETAKEVSAVTGLMVLVTLPRRLVRREQGVLSAQPITRASGGDAEAMRVLRERLRYAGRGAVPRCALFVPAAPATASFSAPIAAAFARVAAADGERVLLIEANLDSPLLGEQLGVSAGRRQASQPEGGLPAVLAGADWRDTLTQDRQAGLDLLLATTRAASSTTLLRGVQFHNMLTEARADYDLVVVNAPAASSSDAAALVQRVDAAVVVVDGRVGQAATHDATARLSNVARTPLAAVFVQRT